MRYMFVERIIKNNDIIHENTIEISKRFKNNVDLTLYV